jgi:CBS domain-containing protein
MAMRKMLDIVGDQKPLTLPPDATVQGACRLMRDRRVGAVLVIEEDRHLVGIFTGRDDADDLAVVDDRNVAIAPVLHSRSASTAFSPGGIAAGSQVRAFSALDARRRSLSRDQP